MKASLAIACALSALLSLTGQAPSGTAVSPPVQVNWCAFNTWTFVPVGAGGMLLVHFTPTNAIADVRFRMLWGDGTFTLVNDAGTFSANNEVHHQLDFQHYGEITGDTMKSLYLAVDHVQLADGSTWEAPLHGTPSVKCEIYFGLGGR